MSHYVYLIGNEKYGWYKIGVSVKPERRMRELNVPFELKIFRQIQVANQGQSYDLEGELHFWFGGSRINQDRTFGPREWFSNIDLIKFDERVAKWIKGHEESITRAIEKKILAFYPAYNFHIEKQHKEENARMISEFLRVDHTVGEASNNQPLTQTKDKEECQ